MLIFIFKQKRKDFPVKDISLHDRKLATVLIFSPIFACQKDTSPPHKKVSKQSIAMEVLLS